MCNQRANPHVLQRAGQENECWKVAGNWNIQRGNTVRYTAESQISFQLRRRLAGNMARSFANSEIIYM